MALIGLGVDRLSITPAAVGPVKAMIRSMNYADTAAKMEQLLADAPADMRGELKKWVQSPKE